MEIYKYREGQIKLKDKKNNTIPIIMIIAGIILICVGIYNFSYASSHTWGNPGSTLDRKTKVPYNQTGTVCVTAGGICAGLGVIIYLGNKKSKVIEVTKKENSNLEELAKLKVLLDNGTITQEEFAQQKEKILKS